jgi:PAS domain S-box-containing protein
MWEFWKRLSGGQPAQSPAACAGPESAEHSLHQSEERFRLLVEQVKDYAIFMLNPQGRIVTWNAGARRLKGYTAEEIIGRHFSVFYPPEVVARGWPEEELRRAAADGRIEDEGWRLRQDGSRFWANVVITALHDDSGTLRGFAKVTRDLTERRQAEEQARKLLQEETARQAAEAASEKAEQARQEERRQREQLHVTLRSIGDGVIVTDREGRVSFMNPVATDLTGWRPQEAAGQPLDRVFHIVNEESRQVVESPVAKVLREGVIVGLANHTVLLTRDRREIPIDDSGAPIRGEDGSIAGVVLVFRDVTEARKAVEARMHLAAIVESSDDAIISKDLNGNIISWNRGAERLYGYTAQEMVGQPLCVLIPPDHPNELPDLLERIKRGERIEHFETVRRCKDGHRVDVSLTISPVRNAEGKVVGASKIARDITAQKRHEATLAFLAEAGKLLGEVRDIPGTLQKVAALAVPHFADWCVLDLLEADGTLRRATIAHADPDRVARAQELSRRYPPRPTGPYGPAHVVCTGQPEMMTLVPDSVLKSGAQDAEHLRQLRELGLRSYLSVPLAARGRIVGVLSFMTAESGRRFGLDDLQIAHELAHRAAVAIDNARLYSELQEADRQKNEWIAMLAHELRNPLAPIRNALHILKMPGADAAAVERARQMTERQVEYMVRLVDDLLDVSRIIRGRIELRKEPVELARVLGRGVETAQPMIDAQGQELVLKVPPEPIWLDADATRLAQVISNLVHNAAKFSARSGRIWLSAERQGTEAVVRVRDEGAGIPATLLPHIFDLFIQGDVSRDRCRGGLGIGLTVVRRLVELHGGTVTAHSAGPGQGSEFVVRLPGILEAPRPGAAAHPDGGLPAVVRRLLVVDDNVDAADSLAMLLRLEGHEVRVAHNGPAALEVVQGYHPDLILLDLGMPGMDGYEVARRLRQQPGLERVRLAALTGWAQLDDRRRTTEAGFDYHLTKPVEPEALQRLLASS